MELRQESLFADETKGDGKEEQYGAVIEKTIA